MQDLWSDSSDYKSLYQSEAEISSVLEKLDLAQACGLVDAGCGNGAFAIAAAQNFPRCQVWAFDALETAIEQCRAHGGALANLTAEVAWAESLPLTGERVDRALLRSVLHHVAQPELVYAEIARVLKPGGLFLLQAPCNNWAPAFGEVLSRIMLSVDTTHPRFFYTPGSIAVGLERAGFKVGKVECWKYEFPFLGEAQAQLVQELHAQERLCLRQIETGKWSIENYWVRVSARKNTQEC